MEQATLYQLRMLCGSDADTLGTTQMTADQVRAMKKSGRSAGSVLEEAAKKEAEPKGKGKRRRRRRRRK